MLDQESAMTTLHWVRLTPSRVVAGHNGNGYGYGKGGAL